MKDNGAVAILEISSIAKGIEASDAMCKSAGVTLSKSAPMPRGKYLIVVAGPVGEVESAMKAGMDMAADTVLAHFIIRNVHGQVVKAFEKKVPAEILEAVGVIETREAAPAVFAADAAVKAAAVHLIEIRAGAGVGGKGYITLTGEVGAVRTAISAGVKAVPEGMLVSRIVIPFAHEHLKKALF
ncbi:MAG: BMC domain-containing protein [bacterium]